MTYLSLNQLINLMKKIILLSFYIISKSFAFENPKINFGSFSINKYEITISKFSKYAETKKVVTAAEKTGGEYEWGAGWEKRLNWTYLTLYGSNSLSELEQAVHINRYEAEDYCNLING